MKFALPTVAMLAFLSLFRCASQTRLAPEIRQTLQLRHVGKTVALKSSCFYGDLYDENERWLLSPHPFADTYHIVDTEGAPIHPTGERGIVPAGSTFRITQIEFPDMQAMATRMLTTPWYNPWVYLEPLSGAELQGRASFIVVLPMDLETEHGVEQALNERFGKPEAVQNWLASRKPTVRAAIRHKDPIVGMNEDELRAAWGSPMLWFEDSGARVAWYRTQEVWLVDGAVTEVRPARKVPGNSPARSNTGAPPTIANLR